MEKIESLEEALIRESNEQSILVGNFWDEVTQVEAFLAKQGQQRSERVLGVHPLLVEESGEEGEAKGKFSFECSFSYFILPKLLTLNLNVS